MVASIPSYRERQAGIAEDDKRPTLLTVEQVEEVEGTCMRFMPLNRATDHQFFPSDPTLQDPQAQG